MAWVAWRQHRLALAGVAALLGALAVYVWTVGLGLHHAYAAATACHPSSSMACSLLVSRFNGIGKVLWYGYVLQLVPPLVGAFVGAPVLARELETGTFRYAWTQGFGGWRWALAKLVPLAVAVAAAAGALSALISWYYQPYFATGNRALSLSEASPLTPGLFDLSVLEPIRTIYEFDDRITAQAFAFGSADNYYATQSANQYLDRIRIPALLVQSKDDPLIPFAVYDHPAFATNPNLRLLAVEHGGHLGFISKTRPRFWLDQVLVNWVLEVRNKVTAGFVS